MAISLAITAMTAMDDGSSEFARPSPSPQPVDAVSAGSVSTPVACVMQIRYTAATERTSSKYQSLSFIHITGRYAYKRFATTRQVLIS